MSGQIDPSLLQDFLTEAGELIEQLDAELIRLESAADEATRTAVLNSVFRAVHTIKGGAGFLGLEAIIQFAHVAEDAFNRLRQGEVAVTASLIDVLLRSADVLRAMIEALGNDEPIPPCPEALLEELRVLAGGASEGASASTGEDQAPSEAAEAAPGHVGGGAVQPLELGAQKLDLLEYMVADLKEAADRIGQCAQRAADPDGRPEAAMQLRDVTDGLPHTAAFFELEALQQLVDLAVRIAGGLAAVNAELADELVVRLGAIAHLIERQAAALERREALSWPLETFAARIDALLANTAPDEHVRDRHEHDPLAVLVLDGVFENDASHPDTPACADAEAPAQSAPSAPGADAGAAAAHRAPEQTIRVEVGRLESLLNLVGQMVLAKNRMLGIGRRLGTQGLAQELIEEINSATNDLDRLTGNLQVGVMRTRMQPLAKLFDRYPRVIRDVARSTGKKIQLQIEGKQTEVDKSVIELLSDPLVHILRNSADHGIEPPEERTAAGKDPTGTIQLTAEHCGSHVNVAIRDDGRGLDRQRLGQKAVQRGLVNAEQLAALSDQEVYEFIFAAGFSTAEQVTDLSGRGVGMDVVRTNVNRMNGSIHVDATPGEGTCIELQIPLTVAIMPAMVVGVGAAQYCVPLQNVVEIVRPEAFDGCRIHDQPVIRLRDAVLPLLDLRHRLGEPGETPAKFALIVNAAGQRAGLLLDRLIGQQEIVIKPLADGCASNGPFSGATIQDTGHVSLILDVNRLVRSANAPLAQAA